MLLNQGTERTEIMDKTLMNVADIFITALESNDSFRAFRTATRDFEESGDLQILRERHSEYMTDLQQRQSDGSLTQDDISRLRAIQEELSGHPLTREFLRCREEITGILADCNQTISEILGFDYSATAAPASVC
jgi:cell fate (sporulation/competence/biofilm development) regulator YlbF (YheA/YmcA/DUF963 family)